MKKKVLLIFIISSIFFIVYLTNFYFLEKNKWMNKDKPYHDAKQWLIGANMLVIPQLLINKIPFVDERSLIMQPLITLQDVFISKWKERLPEDDAEKYIGWYLFKLHNFIIPNINHTQLHFNKTYSSFEVIKMLDNIWYSMEKLYLYKAKDRDFEEMRYIAFLKLSFLYTKNLYMYYFNHNTKNYEYRIMINDNEQYLKLLKLYKMIINIKKYYKKNYPKVYENGLSNFYDSKRLHHLMLWILDFDYLNLKFEKKLNNTFKNIDNYCNLNINIYLSEYLKSRKALINLKIHSDKETKKSIEQTLSDYTDNNLNKMCKNLNLKRE